MTGSRDRKKSERTPLPRQGIQSVGIGISVLQAMVQLKRAAPLSAIAQACGLSASQTHRYLVTLIDGGMASQDPATGRYDLGPQSLAVGLAALARIDAFKLTDDAINQFVEQTGASAHIAAFGPLGPTVVRWHQGSPMVTSLKVGSVLSLLNSATGRIFLSFLPPAETSDLVQSECARDPRISADEVAIVQGRVSRDGYATVDGTFIPGHFAAAFPILDSQRRAVLTATLLTLEGIEERQKQEWFDALRRICTRLSQVISGNDEIYTHPPLPAR
jgi:DNA-binding IclR family transcriptional regulator